MGRKKVKGNTLYRQNRIKNKFSKGYGEVVGEIDIFPAARTEIFGIFFWLNRIFFLKDRIFKLPVFRVQNTKSENKTVRETGWKDL